MTPPTDVPALGDVVWLQFDPQAGHEQAGHRPALVLSPEAYNQRTGLMLCCPLTTRLKGYPFEVLTEVDGVACAVLADQVKSLDWRVGRAERKSHVGVEVLQQVRAKFSALLMGD